MFQKQMVPISVGVSFNVMAHVMASPAFSWLLIFCINCRASCSEAAGARSKYAITRLSDRKKKISAASSGVTLRRCRRLVSRNGNGSKFRCSTVMVILVFEQLFQKPICLVEKDYCNWYAAIVLA